MLQAHWQNLKSLNFVLLWSLRHGGTIKCITRRLRGIHAAWHFWYAVVLVVKVVCGKLV
ncbi:DUF3265 domain-containing protein [Vibrio vulnificus]|nr:DUF3265 domain-containing protein [Vibrio vulnificus]MCU8229924.1 DUF3265 domain-containing protein [Vibrio vulnificus]MCU8242966.1 DUF3265 domain-containing protein [Vibrio vulnificus]MCU8330810.1 DUF3265 domain-containing protein [Vibrio vulnificus]